MLCAQGLPSCKRKSHVEFAYMCIILTNMILGTALFCFFPFMNVFRIWGIYYM